jgi:hypothetical protein
VSARLRRRIRRIRRTLHLRRPPHARLAGEHPAYYFDPDELGVTTTSANDESW